MRNPAIRGLWLAVTVLAGTLVGAAGGLLAWKGGEGLTMAIFAGAGAFAATIMLLLTMVRFATGKGE